MGNEKADEAARNGLQYRNFRRTFFTKADATNMAKKYAYQEEDRLWNLPPHQDNFLRYIDPEMRSKIPRPLPRHLETLYHRLRLDVAYTNNYLYRIGRTTNPYCDNCGNLETMEHILLECPAYRDERQFFEQQMNMICHEPLTLPSVLGPMSGPSKQRRVLDLLFKYLSVIGLIGKL